MLLTVLATGGGTASADPLAARQAEANRVQGQLDALNRTLDRAVEAYDKAAQRLADTDAAIAETQVALRVAEQNLATGQAELSSELAADFRTGQPDPVLVLLSTTSLSDLLQGVDLLRRSSAHTRLIVQRVAADRLAIRQHEQELVVQRAHRRQAVSDRAARKRGVEAALHERSRRLAAVKADIRQILAARAAAARRAAAAAARQARIAARQPPAEDPGLGGAGAGTGTGGTGSGGGGGGGGTSPPPISPPSSASGSAAADAALSQLGVRYQWGGASPSTGFDCSGLVMWAYARVGVSLPHYTGAQRAAGTPVAYSQLQRGDLVFFNGDEHVGIYLGGGQFVHAPHTGDVVHISSLATYSGYSGAVRIL